MNKKLNKQEQDILEWIEMNATIEQWKNNLTGKTELWMQVNNHYQTKKDYFEVYEFDPSKQQTQDLINKYFKETTKKIIQDINTQNRQVDNFVLEKTVWRHCPNALCGDNPCSCEDD